MSFGNRKWWQIGGLRGDIAPKYHHFDGWVTACGLKASGKFIAHADTPKDKVKKRCLACVRAISLVVAPPPKTGR